MVTVRYRDEEQLPGDKITPASTWKEQLWDSIKAVLQSHGIADSRYLAVVAADETGNVRVYSSNAVMPYLDDVKSQFRAAFERAMRETSYASSSGHIASERPDDFAGDALNHMEPSVRSRTKRLRSRFPRHVGRSMISQVTARNPRASYSRHSEVRRVTQPDSNHEVSFQQERKKLTWCRIDETDKVTAFLQSRLKGLQQLADKKIAKAWIKGICPKKQAKFPYQSNKREDEPTRKPFVPEWWPDTDTICRFIEPDHIKRDERMNLCIHLLRLRPSPAQLSEWNHDEKDPESIPAVWPGGWTGLLQSLAGNEIFGGIYGLSKDTIAHRQILMHQMYHVAAMEESFLEGSIDGSTTFAWPEDEEPRRSISNKRKRQPSVASDTEMTSRESSVAADSGRPTKALRRDSISEPPTTLHQPITSMEGDVEMVVNFLTALDTEPLGNAFSGVEQREPTPEHGLGQCNEDAFLGLYEPCDAVAMKRESTLQSHDIQDNIQWQASEQLMDPLSSFGSDSSAGVFESDPHQSYVRTSAFSGTQNHAFTQYEQRPRALQVRQVRQVPDPQFQAVPMAPAFSPSTMVSMPLNASLPHGRSINTQEQFLFGKMPATSDEYYTPVQQEHTIAMPQQPFHQQRLHDHQGHASQDFASLHCHGLTHTERTEWQEQQLAMSGLTSPQFAGHGSCGAR